MCLNYWVPKLPVPKLPRFMVLGLNEERHDTKNRSMCTVPNIQAEERGLLLVVLATLLTVSPGSGASTSGRSFCTVVVALERASVMVFVLPLVCSNLMLKWVIVSNNLDMREFSISVMSFLNMPQIVELSVKILISRG